MQKLFHKLTLRLAVLLTLGVIAFSTASYADDPLCDGALWTQMTERARLNGQQDVSTAENLIYKPDSILEYVCMQQFSDFIPTHVSYFMLPALAGSTGAPGGVIDQIVNTWITNNFGHTYMGGRNPADPPSTVAAGAYNCNTMDYVWKVAKCLHAGELAPQDNLVGVYEFLTSPDSRVLPTACAAPGAATMGNAPVTVPPTPSITLAVIPTGVNCGQPIPTGTTVNLGETSDSAYSNTFPVIAGGRRIYNEKICQNPDCHYVPTSLDAGSCLPPAAPAATP